MKKIFSLILLVLATALSFGDSVQVATLPLLGNKTLAVVVDGSGHVFVRLADKGLTLSPSDAMEISAYLDRFLSVDEEFKKPGVTVTELLGARAFVPLTPVRGKLFMLAVVMKDRGNAMGFRLVDYASLGGWGRDATYYMTSEAVVLLKQTLVDAVDRDKSLRQETAKIRTRITDSIN